jgi:hypothetical protein
MIFKVCNLDDIPILSRGTFLTAVSNFNVLAIKAVFVSLDDCDFKYDDVGHVTSLYVENNIIYAEINLVESFNFTKVSEARLIISTKIVTDETGSKTIHYPESVYLYSPNVFHR